LQYEITVLNMGKPEDRALRLARAIIRLMVGNDLEKARKRIRNAWVAGFIWSAWSYVGAVGLIITLVSETAVEGPGLGLFIAVVVEVGLIAFLSYRVMRRGRWAATSLFFYFWTSRIFWMSIGLIRLETWPDIAGFFLVQVLPAYLFFQGMRGAWTFHYLTHPQYSADPKEKVEPSVSSTGGVDKNEEEG
jgi:hypothetical protein